MNKFQMKKMNKYENIEENQPKIDIISAQSLSPG